MDLLYYGFSFPITFFLCSALYSSARVVGLRYDLTVKSHNKNDSCAFFCFHCLFTKSSAKRQFDPEYSLRMAHLFHCFFPFGSIFSFEC